MLEDDENADYEKEKRIINEASENIHYDLILDYINQVKSIQASAMEEVEARNRTITNL